MTTFGDETLKALAHRIVAAERDYAEKYRAYVEARDACLAAEKIVKDLDKIQDNMDPKPFRDLGTHIRAIRYGAKTESKP